MSGADPSIDLVQRERDESVVLGQGPVFVRWRAEVANVFPELMAAIERFEAGRRVHGQGRARWLRKHGLVDPQESIPYLMLDSGSLQGFYALSNGQAEIGSNSREDYGLS